MNNKILWYTQSSGRDWSKFILLIMILDDLPYFAVKLLEVPGSRSQNWNEAVRNMVMGTEFSNMVLGKNQQAIMYSKLVASFGQQQKFTYHVPFLIQGLSKCFVRPKSSPVLRNYNFSRASISFLLKISGKVARNFLFDDIWFIHISSVHCQIYFWNLQSYKC